MGNIMVRKENGGAVSPRLPDVPHRPARGSWWIDSPQCNAGWVYLITSCSRVA